MIRLNRLHKETESSLIQAHVAIQGALPGERAQQTEALGILSVWVRASDSWGFRKQIKGKRRGMIRPGGVQDLRHSQR